MAEREQLIEAAIRDRKIGPGDRERYGAMYDTQPAMARQLLAARVQDGGFAPGIIPASVAQAAADAYPDAWLPPSHRPATTAQVPAEDRRTRRRGGKGPLAGGAVGVVRDTQREAPAQAPPGQRRSRVTREDAG
jgi:hypothetical protein